MTANLSTYRPKFRAPAPVDDREIDTIEPVTAWFDRLRFALQRLAANSASTEPIEVVVARDPMKWRNLAYVEGICTTCCYGLGVPVHDGHGGVDYEPCPICDQGFSHQPFDDVPF